MEAKDLRIGNYIQATHEETISRGNGIDEDVEILLTLMVRGVDLDSQLIDGSCTFSLEEIDTDYQLDKYNDLEPIPLTKEWLFKFGLEEMDGWDDQIYYCCPNNQEFQVMLCNDGYEYDYTVLKYVHQLQNLYFALTGKELTLAAHPTV